LTKHLKGAEPSAQASLLLLAVEFTPARGFKLMGRGAAGSVSTWSPWWAGTFLMQVALQVPQA
jgi:hypothetical protein